MLNIHVPICYLGCCWWHVCCHGDCARSLLCERFAKSGVNATRFSVLDSHWMRRFRRGTRRVTHPVGTKTVAHWMRRESRAYDWRTWCEAFFSNRRLATASFRDLTYPRDHSAWVWRANCKCSSNHRCVRIELNKTFHWCERKTSIFPLEKAGLVCVARSFPGTMKQTFTQAVWI